MMITCMHTAESSIGVMSPWTDSLSPNFHYEQENLFLIFLPNILSKWTDMVLNLVAESIYSWHGLVLQKFAATLTIAKYCSPCQHDTLCQTKCLPVFLKLSFIEILCGLHKHPDHQSSKWDAEYYGIPNTSFIWLQVGLCLEQLKFRIVQTLVRVYLARNTLKI